MAELFTGMVSFFLALLPNANILPAASQQVASRSEIVITANDEYSNFQIIDGIRTAENTNPSASIAVVPHHLVAHKGIAEGVASLHAETTETIVVLSPDHFDACPTLLCTTHGTFETFFGPLPIEESVAEYFVKGGATRSPHLFTNEHGITAVVPFIKYFHKNVSVVPLVVSVSQSISPTEKKELEALFSAIVNEKMGLIVSSDFSHYLSLADSNIEDAKTQDALCSMDTERVLALHNPRQSDCPVCLYLATTLARKQRLVPEIISHTNSAELLGDYSAEETTSHMSVAFVPEGEVRTSCNP